MTIVMCRVKYSHITSTIEQHIFSDDIKTLREYTISMGLYLYGHVFCLLLVQAVTAPSFEAVIALAYAFESRTRKEFKLI